MRRRGVRRNWQLASLRLIRTRNARVHGLVPSSATSLWEHRDPKPVDLDGLHAHCDSTSIQVRIDSGVLASYFIFFPLKNQRMTQAAFHRPSRIQMADMHIKPGTDYPLIILQVHRIELCSKRIITDLRDYWYSKPLSADILLYLKPSFISLLM
ncbi:hypothetical protein BJY00DRAFT_247503 [Aspergillus carlsbadensis]|nr:hypothetical protein BJY00DRAFT_247503 [Aspergillus carlsbadensis]